MNTYTEDSPRDIVDKLLVSMLHEKGITSDEINERIRKIPGMSSPNMTKYTQRITNISPNDLYKRLSIRDEYAYLIRGLFRKSKRKQGNIYLCEYYPENMVNIDYDTGLIEPFKAYKYGRTVNMENRLLQYGERYQLYKSWQTNHVKLREYLIHSDTNICEQRAWKNQHDNDEHVYDLDCRNIVEYYATADIKLSHEFGRYTIEITPTVNFTEYGRCDREMIELLHAL